MNNVKEEVSRIKNLMDIENPNREYLLKQVNFLIDDIDIKALDRKDKLRIIGYVAATLLGSRKEKYEGISRLEKLITDNPELCKHYLKVSGILKIAAKA